jgi:hypothetical protein
VVVVAVGLEVEHERRVTLQAQGRRAEDRAVQALHAALDQHPARRPAFAAGGVVVELVEETLDARGRRERAQAGRLARGEAEIGCHGVPTLPAPAARIKSARGSRSRRRRRVRILVDDAAPRAGAR